MTKTNVMRLLDAAGIRYRTAEYEYDESDLSGKHAAEQLDLPAEQVFKTLVARGDKTGLVVFCIPVPDELDLRRAASVSGNKKVELCWLAAETALATRQTPARTTAPRARRLHLRLAAPAR